MISYKLDKILAIFLLVERTMTFTAHARKRLFRSFRSKTWPCHSLRRPRFPV